MNLFLSSWHLNYVTMHFWDTMNEPANQWDYILGDSVPFIVVLKCVVDIIPNIRIWMHLAQWNHAILGSWLHRRTPQQLLRSRQHRHCWQWLWAVATHRRPQAPPLPRNRPWWSTGVQPLWLRRLMCSNFGTGKMMENPSDSGSQWFTLGLHVT